MICTVGEDVMEGNEDGDRAKYILIPSDTVTTNTVSHTMSMLLNYSTVND